MRCSRYASRHSAFFASAPAIRPLSALLRTIDGVFALVLFAPMVDGLFTNHAVVIRTTGLPCHNTIPATPALAVVALIAAVAAHLISVVTPADRRQHRCITATAVALVSLLPSSFVLVCGLETVHADTRECPTVAVNLGLDRVAHLIGRESIAAVMAEAGVGLERVRIGGADLIVGEAMPPPSVTPPRYFLVKISGICNALVLMPLGPCETDCQLQPRQDLRSYRFYQSIFACAGACHAVGALAAGAYARQRNWGRVSTWFMAIPRG
jgi:hypothetical protein